MLDFDDFEVLTFDCYGTLIDWESGILEALRPVMLQHNIALTNSEILELYAEFESFEEESEYVNYRNILNNLMQKISERFGFTAVFTAYNVLADSIRDWKPFPDTVDALRAFKTKYRLAVISNIDDDLFAHSAKHLEIPFDWIITAEKARSYKPSLNNFYYAFQKMDCDHNKILHIAQSIHHDIVPAKRLGLKTVWVKRSRDAKGFGATPPANASPDLQVPDLATLVSMMGLS